MGTSDEHRAGGDPLLDLAWKQRPDGRLAIGFVGRAGPMNERMGRPFVRFWGWSGFRQRLATLFLSGFWIDPSEGSLGVGAGGNWGG